MNSKLKNIALMIFVFMVFMYIWDSVDKNPKKNKEINYSQFITHLESRQIFSTKKKPLIIRGDIIKGKYRKNSNYISFKSQIPVEDNKLVEIFEKNKWKYKNGLHYKFVSDEESPFVRAIMYILPWLLIIGFIWFIMMRQLSSTGNKAMSFGKSKAKLHSEEKSKVTFKDVAGVVEAKEELEEVVEFLKEPDKYTKIGAKIPRGVLLVGPPGTGKTLLARAVAGEAKVPFFSISGSDFVEMFVGVGASRVRDLFGQAKKSVPCIVFIDEIDAVGRLRGAGMGGGHDEREQTLNQLLVEMDGFEDNEGVIVIAATNRSDVLDPALLRPGRFDRQVVVDAPDMNGRTEILKIHSKKVPLAKEVVLEEIAQGTPGFTGADLANLINEGALLAARRNEKKVSQSELEEAKDKVMMGPERKSFFITPEEKAIIAYHEAGHALLGSLLDHAETVHKVTIIPRGSALGITWHMPDSEKHMRSKNYWLDQVVVLMGGRLAEEMQFKDVTTGAANDIERATAIAKKMVMEWGMSDKIGPIHLAQNDSNSVFLGRDYTKQADHSDEYAQLVDEEIKLIIDTSYSKGKQMLKKYKKRLTDIAQALLEKETINAIELIELINLPTITKKFKSRQKEKEKAKIAAQERAKENAKIKEEIILDVDADLA